MEEKRSEILSAAKDVLIAQGKNAKMSDIAARLDIETSSLYYYYKGIPEVLNALLIDKYRDLETFEDEMFKPDKSHFQLLREMVVYLMEFYLENLDLVQIILTQVFPLFHAPELEDESDAINDYLLAYWNANTILLRHIRGAQAAGTIDHEIEPDQILHVLRGAMWGVVASWRDHPTSKEDVSYCVDRIFRMLT